MKMSGLTENPQRLAIWIGLLVVGVPLLLSPFDYWDGRIMYYALDTHQDIGVREWFFTSGWIIQYYIFAAVQRLDDLTGLHGLWFFRLIILASVCGLIYEAARFYRETLRLPASWAGLGAMVVALFPAWNVFVASSVIFIYIMCSWLVLLALRLLHQSSCIQMAFGVVVLLISFQLNSNFIFAMALAAVYLLAGWLEARRMNVAGFWRFAGICALSVGAYLLLKSLFTPSGLYEGYNQMHLPHSLKEVLKLAVELLRYCQYPLLVAAVLLGGYVGLRVLGIAKRAVAPEKLTWPLLWPIAASLMLLFAAMLPYVIVGKPADLRAIMVDWNPRHTFLMAMPLGLFMASFGRLLSHRLAVSWRSFAPAFAVLVILLVMQQASFWHKLARGAYEAGMIAALAKETPPPAGLVKVIAPQMPAARLRYYESNWLFAMAYGREAWFTRVVPSEKEDINPPAWVDAEGLSNAAHRSKHIMRDFETGCVSQMRIVGEPFAAKEVLLWALLGKALPDTLSVSQISSDCS